MLVRKVQVFRNGRSRAVRIPKEFDRFEDSVLMRQDGDILMIEPIRKRRSLKEVLAAMEPYEGEFPEIEDLPAEDVTI